MFNMWNTQHLQVQSTFNMFQHSEGSADNMLSTFAVVTRPAMDEPLEMAKQAGKWSQIVPNRPKIVQNRLKSLKIARFLHLRLTTQDQTSTFTTFTSYKATGRVNIQHCCQHLQRMASTSNINSCGVSINVFPHGYLKEAACRVARGRWSDMEGIDAREAERRWCNDPMPSAEEDKAWWAAALVLASLRG